MDANSYFASLEQKYGLPAGYLARTRAIESGGNDNAQNPKSSAGGPFQFIDSTARSYGLNNRFDLMESADAAARLARDNRSHLVRVLGREPTGAELYLAHQQGGGGAADLLSGRSVDATNMALNGGVQNPNDFASMWINKYNGVGGATGGPNFTGSPGLSMSTRGAPTMTPFVKRESIIKQLLGGEGFAGKTAGMFNPIEGANPRLEQERFQSRQARFNALQGLNAAQMAGGGGPIHWTQTLAGVGSGIGANIAEGAAGRAGEERSAQLNELLASGAMTPEVLARIAALDPEYGATMMDEQRRYEREMAQMQTQFNQQNYSREDEQAAQTARDELAYGREAADAEAQRQHQLRLQDDSQLSQAERDQAQREHELAIAQIPSEDRTAMERQLIAAGYDPNGPVGADGLNDFQREMRKQIAGDTSQDPGLSITFDANGNPVIRQGPGVNQPAPTGAAAPATGTANPAADPSGLGKIPESTARGLDPNGQLRESPIPGSAAAAEAEAVATAALNAENDLKKTGNVVLDAIDQAMPMISNWSTGFLGKGLRDLGFGGTDAADLEIALRPVVANIGFTELNEMRAASPTGAALGQVTERENTLLQSTIKAIDPNGSPELLKKNLQYVRDVYDVMINTNPNDPAQVARYEQIMGFPLVNRAGGQAGQSAASPAQPQGGAAAPAAAQSAPAVAPPAPAVIPTPQTQAEFDMLPSGTIFIDPDDGQQYRKP
jgi:hypothetical protein